MNPDEINLKERVRTLENQIQELLDWKRQKQEQQLDLPIDDASRIILGMGVIGEDTTTTTASKAVIVDTNVGKLKVLVG